MAAAIDTTATTLEGQLWEVANRTQLAELSQPIETRPTNTTTTVDTENGTVSVTFTCPATFTIGATGALTAAPTPYLP